MWVVFRISDRQVMGSTVDAGVQLTKKEAIAEIVGGLEGTPLISEFDAIEVNEREEQETLLQSGMGRAKVTNSIDGSLRLDANVVKEASVQVTTNAANFHPVDGVPLLAGDGQSFLVVTLTKLVSSGEDTSLIGGGENVARAAAPIGGEDKLPDEVIWLRPSHGSIRADNETRTEIRSVTLVNGTARFRFYSDAAKRLASVQMLSSNPNLQLGGLQVEFI